MASESSVASASRRRRPIRLRVTQASHCSRIACSVPENTTALARAFSYNEIRGDLKRDVAQLTAGTSKVSDEKGVEVFYDLAITPAHSGQRHRASSSHPFGCILIQRL